MKDEKYSLNDDESAKVKLLKRAEQHDSAITKEAYIITINCDDCGKYYVHTTPDQHGRLPAFCLFCGNPLFNK